MAMIVAPTVAILQPIFIATGSPTCVDPERPRGHGEYQRCQQGVVHGGEKDLLQDGCIGQGPLAEDRTQDRKQRERTDRRHQDVGAEQPEVVFQPLTHPHRHERQRGQHQRPEAERGVREQVLQQAGTEAEEEGELGRQVAGICEHHEQHQAGGGIERSNPDEDRRLDGDRHQDDEHQDDDSPRLHGCT